LNIYALVIFVAKRFLAGVGENYIVKSHVFHRDIF